MFYKKLRLSVLLVFSIGLKTLQAQEAIPATGGDAFGIGGSASYTAGQTVYTTNIGTNGSVAQGIQHPFEIIIVTSLLETGEINLVCSAYPNPVTEYVTLKVENYKTENLSCQLFDINGKLIKSKKVEGDETVISMGNLVPSSYFLKVIDNNKEVKTFKIIKN